MLEGNRERSTYSIRKIMDEGKQFMWIPATFRTSSHQQQQVYRYISPRMVYVCTYYNICLPEQKWENRLYLESLSSIVSKQLVRPAAVWPDSEAMNHEASGNVHGVVFQSHQLSTGCIPQLLCSFIIFIVIPQKIEKLQCITIFARNLHIPFSIISHVWMNYKIWMRISMNFYMFELSYPIFQNNLDQE
jgi:hypothetical protein